MELFNIKCFITVARLEHMSEAAEIMNVSQPNISKIIKNIEAELGVKLFEKYGRNIKLTPYGKIFYKDMLPVIEDYDTALLHLQSIKNQIKPYLKIVAPPLFSFPNLAPKLYKENPGIKIDNMSIPYENMTMVLQEGTVDFCILARPIDQTGLECDILTNDELVILISDKHPKAVLDEAKLIDFKNEPFTDYAEVVAIRSERERFCQEAGFESKVAIIGKTLFDLIEAVKQGNCVALIPYSMLHNYKTEGTKAIRIIEPVCRSHLRLYWNPSNLKSPEMKKIRAEILEYFKEYSQATE